jgi:hypothetical protein
MSNLKKHVGKDSHGKRVVVVFREIPGAEDHCLCVQSDSLMDMHHDQLMREVDSRDAQSTVNLYELLERRHFGDGRQMLNGLHEMGRLQKYPISEITMYPMPNRPVPLALVNAQISGEGVEDVARQYGIEVPGGAAPVEAPAEAPAENPVVVDTEAGLVKPVEVNPVTVGDDVDSKAAAESKLLQARLMEEDAKKMREEAYALDPSLKKGGRPSKKQQKKVAKAKGE